MTATDPAKTTDDLLAEVPSSIGLLLTVAAVMLAVLALAGVSTGQATAGALAVGAAIGFGGAFVCFAIDGRRHEQRTDGLSAPPAHTTSP